MSKVIKAFLVDNGDLVSVRLDWESEARNVSPEDAVATLATLSDGDSTISYKIESVGKGKFSAYVGPESVKECLPEFSVGKVRRSESARELVKRIGESEISTVVFEPPTRFVLLDAPDATVRIFRRYPGSYDLKQESVLVPNAYSGNPELAKEELTKKYGGGVVVISREELGSARGYLARKYLREG